MAVLHRRRAPWRHASAPRMPLTALPLFAGCSGRERRLVDRLGTRIRVRPGRVLTAAGGRGTESFVVLCGFASCLVAGREVALFGTGDFFGEVSVLDGGPRTAMVVAETEMELLVLTTLAFEHLTRALPAVAHRMLGVLAERLRLATDAALA